MLIIVVNYTCLSVLLARSAMGDDGREALWIKARAADQRSIDVGLRG